MKRGSLGRRPIVGAFARACHNSWLSFLQKRISNKQCHPRPRSPKTRPFLAHPKKMPTISISRPRKSWRFSHNFSHLFVTTKIISSSSNSEKSPMSLSSLPSPLLAAAVAKAAAAADVEFAPVSISKKRSYLCQKESE